MCDDKREHASLVAGALPDRFSKVYGEDGCPGRLDGWSAIIAPRPLLIDNLIHYAHRFLGSLAAGSEVAHAG